MLLGLRQHVNRASAFHQKRILKTEIKAVDTHQVTSNKANKLAAFNCLLPNNVFINYIWFIQSGSFLEKDLNSMKQI